MLTNDLQNAINQALESGTVAPVEGSRRTQLQGWSFYRLTQSVNAALQHYGLDTVTPQYIRSLAMHGRVDGVVRTGMKDVRFTDEQAQKFIIAFVGGRVQASRH